jgi:predicted ribosomally synthesized peptide with nif11-like leader
MSVEQFSALLAQLQADPGLKEKLSGAADLDAALAIAKDAGFDVTPDDLNNDQASQGSISAEELAAISGGKGSSNSVSDAIYDALFAPLPVNKKPTGKP